MVMRKDESVVDFSLTFSKIMSKLRNLGEKLWKKDVVLKLITLKF